MLIYVSGLMSITRSAPLRVCVCVFAKRRCGCERRPEDRGLPVEWVLQKPVHYARWQANAVQNCVCGVIGGDGKWNAVCDGLAYMMDGPISFGVKHVIYQ